MINIKETTNIKTDNISPTATWYFYHNSKKLWYVFRITEYDDYNNRYASFILNDDVNAIPDDNETITINKINERKIYIFNSNSGIINANMFVGEYDVYKTSTLNTNHQDNIKEIEQLSMNDDYHLYLKYDVYLAKK